MGYCILRSVFFFLFFNYFYDSITLLSMFSNNFLIWRDENYFIITFVSIIKLLLNLLEKILINTQLIISICSIDI